MRQIFTIIIFACIFQTYKTQVSTFPYNLDWGTYVGGCGTLLMDKYSIGYSFHKDSQNNIYTGGQTMQQQGYTPTYYNQFVIGGGNTIVPSVFANDYSVKFSSAGQFLSGGYDGVPTGTGYKNLIGIDNLDNKYYLENLTGNFSNLATPGVWLSANPLPNGNFTATLSKYNSSGTLLWKTYLPNTTTAGMITLRMDTKDGSIFVMGRTNTEIPNLGTAGVFQQNYIPLSASQNFNMYLVKVSSSGQKLWATYLPVGTIDYEVSGNSIFILTNIMNTAVPNLTTAGTFQPDVPARQAILKFSTGNGTRDWGTYFGSPGIDYSGFANEIEVSDTGIYVSGTSADLVNNGYFATPGAYKTNITGSSDIYLNKFDFSGNRLWGTYFGSNNADFANGYGNIAIFGNKIVMTGKQYSNTDNIATPGAFRTTPLDNYATASNSFFTEFDSQGNFKYCSYFLSRANSIYADDYSPEFLSDGSLVIWGSTTHTTAVGTPGAAFPAMINPYPSIPFGYIVKFVLKNPLSTSEISKTEDLILYDNPNNGNFYLKGNILEKQKTSLKIIDMSGRLIAEQKLEKNKINSIEMKGKLSAGNYILQLLSQKGEQIKNFKMMVK